ncbi:uncharacterized protein LOC126893574 [Daktulosphaira vitifoliae]|uniref:uncharacterized protein LOC126893574 n=1 Tax=Daktulosphaira vitifoliae TaxID=58002 RepID=UPI0021A9CD64|nr:uncharacterized protein LOC126893574 [Daktulosphaira vitifoliae]
MDFTNFFKNLFRFNNIENQDEIPSKFELPSRNGHEISNPNDHQIFTDPNFPNIEDSIHMFHQSIGDIIKTFAPELVDELFSDNFINNDTNIFSNKPFAQEENQFNGIPRSNYMAQRYFLNPRLTKDIKLNESYEGNMFQRLPNITLNSNSYNVNRIYHLHDGRMLEKEVITSKLQSGQIEKTITMKDGNKSLISIITENPTTGQQSFKNKLVNLDESELEDFKKKFPKD